MGRTVVIALSFGTVMVIGCSIAMLSLAVVLGAALHKPTAPTSPIPSIWVPKTGSAGQINEVKNELKYGPVNLDAAKEEKNGLFDRLRSRRTTRSCTTPVQFTQVSNCQAQASVCGVTTIQPSNLPMSQPAVPGKIEHPVVNPLDQVASNDDCLPCLRPNPRLEKKTGGFVCSHCRQQKVGDEWHTDWRSDGTPITFLCESCYRRMTDSQRAEAYKSYAKRHLAKNSNLLFQEVAEVK